MGPAQSTHPSKEQLAAFIQGRLGPAEQAELERHIAQCAACCRTLQEIPDDTLLGNMRARLDTTPLEKAARFQPGMLVDNAEEVPADLQSHPRYRILKLLGKGGMGEVYLAEHRLMERMVALKVIHRSLTQNPHAVERFRSEVKAAARLSHPNIVTEHDADMAGDAHFLVMEYIEGISLARYVEKRAPLPVSHACNFVRQAARGLQHAHEQGMVHRDIKPQNLMLTRQGQVKILDFGLARFARAEQRRRLTEVDTVLGTPDYIAPEQITSARQVDIRADIYSLGSTLYYLLAGRTPFPAGTFTQKVTAHLERTPPPITQVREDIPAELAKIVERMMAKAPADRYQKPAEVVQALASWSTSAPPVDPAAQTQTVRPKRAGQTQVATLVERAVPLPRAVVRRRWMIALAAVAFVVGLGAFYWSPRPGTPRDGGDKQQKGVRLAGSQKPRMLMVLAQKGFWWPDYGPVRQALEEGGVGVKVASLSRNKALPLPDERWGEPVQPDLALRDARVEDFEAIYFAGSMEPAYVGDLPGAEAARKLIHDMLAQKKVVTAQCRGVIVLADAGALRGKPAARSTNLNRDVSDDAALWDRNRPCVVAGTIITGRDFTEYAVFTLVLLTQLKKQP